MPLRDGREVAPCLLPVALALGLLLTLLPHDEVARPPLVDLGWVPGRLVVALLRLP